MKRAISEGECKVVDKNGEKWVYKCLDRHVHKKGWKDLSTGSGAARIVDDADFEAMSSMMKKSGWEQSLGELSVKEEKMLEDKGRIPEKQTQKLKHSTNAWVYIYDIRQGTCYLGVFKFYICIYIYIYIYIES